MALKLNATVEVDPISRIEGHLGVKLTTDGTGHVSEARVHGNLWRGFENFLIGRNPNDAITFTQRICGVCPVPHGTASLFAVESVYGYNDCFQTFGAAPLLALSSTDSSTIAANAKVGVPAKALHIRNLVLSAEFLMSSITHFYHLAAPSYVQGPNMAPWTPYFDNSYYNPLLLSAGHGTDGGAGTGVLPLTDTTNGFSADLWSAVIKQYVKALRIRRLTFEAGALFAGRMPMTSAWIAGGVATAGTDVLTTKCQKFRDMIAEVGAFIVKEYVPLVLALGALYTDYDNGHNGGQSYGGGVGNYISWGAFPQVDGTLALGRGFKQWGVATAAVTKAGVYANLREHIKYSRYVASQTLDNAGATLAAGVTDPASEDRTQPVRNDAAKYSWLKAPRWNGISTEVGPLARLAVMGLIQDNVAYATSVDLTPFGLADYADYVHSSALGLDPKMVEPDLAVALLREGLAELHCPAGVVGKTVGTNGVTLAVAGVPKATIVAQYTDASSYITGTVTSWILALKGGKSNMDRLRARAIESLYLVQKMVGGYNKTTGFPAMGGWVGDLNSATGSTFIPKAVPTGTVSGFGATEAPRGALMHFITINGGKIAKYQCVVPTTWNASPHDVSDTWGPMEEAMRGIPYSAATSTFKKNDGTTGTAGGGVEALRVAQSFDPCIACAVH